MSKSRKREPQKATGNFYSPYSNIGNDMTEYYTAYKNDPYKFVDIDGMLFSKIISRCEFYLREDNIILVTFEPSKKIRTGDILIDEEGRKFTVKGFKMYRFLGGIPEWYSKIVTVIIQGEDYLIGKYIAKADGD